MQRTVHAKVYSCDNDKCASPRRPIALVAGENAIGERYVCSVCQGDFCRSCIATWTEPFSKTKYISCLPCWRRFGDLRDSIQADYVARMGDVAKHLGKVIDDARASATDNLIAMFEGFVGSIEGSVAGAPAEASEKSG